MDVLSKVDTIVVLSKFYVDKIDIVRLRELRFSLVN